MKTAPDPVSFSPMAAPVPNPRDQLISLLERLLHLDAPSPAPDRLAPLLPTIDAQTADHLLALLESCCDQSGLLSPTPDTSQEVHLCWPHRGQYYVQATGTGSFIHPDPTPFLAAKLNRFLEDLRLAECESNPLAVRPDPLQDSSPESTSPETPAPAPPLERTGPEGAKVNSRGRKPPVTAPPLQAESPERAKESCGTPPPATTSPDRIRALADTANRLIALIARSENLRHQLWLKKKFVLETHYCVTLDRVPHSLYPEIAANNAQRADWLRLYAIDQTEPDYSVPLSVAFLEAHPHLMLDTRFFDAAFTNRLLSSFDDLDEAIDGTLIQADNFHALRLLEPRYRDAIDCIYTDPPYNTGGADLSYPDRYPRAQWLTLMDNRLRLAHRLLKPGGACFISIDENEQARLELLLGDIFAPEDFVATFVWEAGRKNDSKLVSISHEYMLCYVKDLASPAHKRLSWRVRKEGIDEIYAKARWLVRQYKGDYRQASQRLRQWLNGLPDNHPARRHKHYSCVDERGVYHPGNISWPGGGGPRYEVLHPITGCPCKIPSRGWMYPTPQRMAEAIRDGLVHFGPDETRVPCAKVYLHTNEHQAPNSVFYRDNRSAMKRLRHILGADCFCNPKDELLIADRIRLSSPPDATVLDCFAGSGTTAHAVIHLNRDDGGRRKYVLIEMGEAFDSVLRTRLQRVAYTSNWKYGIPQTRDGFSHMFKYLRLESYDDALANTERAPSASEWGVHELAPSASEWVEGRVPHPFKDGGAIASYACGPRVQETPLAPSASEWVEPKRTSSATISSAQPTPSSAQGPERAEVNSRGREPSVCEPSHADGALKGRKTELPLSYTERSDGRLILNTDALTDPFNCRLQITDKDPAAQSHLTLVDAIETFNHLLGLRIRRVRTDDAHGIHSIEALSPEGRRILVVWRKLAQDKEANLPRFTAWLNHHTQAAAFDIIYANGPDIVDTLPGESRHWELRRIEPVFEQCMFDMRDNR